MKNMFANLRSNDRLLAAVLTAAFVIGLFVFGWLSVITDGLFFAFFLLCAVIGGLYYLVLSFLRDEW